MSQIERILRGSLELFLRAGIKSITMDDIAKHIGMSKKTIYQFFKDKNELVTAVLKARLKEDEEQINDIIGKSNDVIEEMINMMKCSEEIFAEMNPTAVHDMQKYHPEAWAEFQKFKAEVLISTMEALLTKGMQQGYIRKDIDVKIIARMRVSQIELGFNTEVFPIGEFNTWNIQMQFEEHFNYGVCTLKGYKLLNQYKNIHDE